MTNRLHHLAAAIAVAFTGMMAPPSDAATTKECPAETTCVDTRSFAATVTNFRTSTQGRHRVLTATVRFENKTGKALTMGYVRGSGVALDDLGNRYVVSGANAVRAIGEISGSTFDPKFTLQPGEGSDTRFELVWEPGKAIVGTTYELDLAVREIAPIAGDQFRLGQEHALHFAGLAQASANQASANAAPAAVAAVPSASNAAAAPAAPAPVVDPCGDAPRCYNAGAFIAEIMQVSPSSMTAGARHQTLMLNVRFRNISGQPIILAYRSASSAGIDNFGNRYYWGRPGTHDTSVKGIGIVDNRKADPQFVLNPAQTRNATFNVVRFNAAPPLGTAYSYDVVIDEIEVLPGQQIRSVRQNSLNFTNLTAGVMVGDAGDAASAVNSINEAGRQLGEGLKSLFKKK